MRPPKTYKAHVGMLDAKGTDLGLSFNIELPANSQRQAIGRIRRSMNGKVHIVIAAVPKSISTFNRLFPA